MVSQFMLILLLSLLAGASGARPHRHLIIQEDVQAKQVRQQASAIQGPGRWKPFQRLKTWWRKDKAARNGKASEKKKTPAVAKKDKAPAETEKDSTPEEAEANKDKTPEEIRELLRKAHGPGSPFHELVDNITWSRALESDEMKRFISQRPTEGFEAFRLLAADEDSYVREDAAVSPAWPELFRQNATEAFQIFKTLAADDDSGVRSHAADKTPAWPDAFKHNGAEAWRIFKNLVKDNDESVGRLAAKSPAWPAAFQQNAAGTLRLFKGLFTDKDLLRSAILSPGWPPAFQDNAAEAWRLLKGLVTHKKWSVRGIAAESPAWTAAFKNNPTKAWRLFKTLVNYKLSKVRQHAAASPAWPAAFQQNAAEALRIFKTFAADRNSDVKRKAAISPAWPGAFQENAAEALQIFQPLVTTGNWEVRATTAASPAWPEAFKHFPMKALQLLKQLATDKDHHSVRRALADSKAAWRGLTNAFLPRSADLLRAASDLQAIAIVGHMKKVEATKMLKDIVAIVQKSHDEEFLEKMANYPLTLAAKRLVEIANEQRKGADDARKKTEEALKEAKAERAAADEARQLAEARRKEAEAQRKEAQEAREESEARQKEAVAAKEEAELQRQVAEKERKAAEEAREKVEVQRKKAVRAWEEAESQKQQAEKAREDSEVQQKKAVAAKTEAELQQKEAEKAQKAAEEAQKESDLQRERADQESELAKKEARRAHLARQNAEKARKESEGHQQEAREEAEKAKLALKAAEEAKENAQKAERHAKLLLAVALLFGASAVFFFLLWFHWPAISQWREEREVIRQAKVALKEAEKCTAPSSSDPASPVDLDVLQKYREIYEKVDVLYKYECLKPALRETFRICTKALEDGLSKWDFSAVEKQSQESESDPMAKLAKANYDWARGFINQKPGEIEHWEPLMKLCEELKSRAEEYPETIEKKYKDPVERCMEMYRQAFMAKSVYFEPTIEKIAAATGAKAKIGNVKGIFRLAEKNALRPEQGLIWDSVRAMLVGRTFNQLAQVLQLLKEEHDAKRIKILEVNNRFAKPTQGGWQDIAVYIMFTDTDFDGLVAEIQLTHQALQAVRENFGAHDAYVANRFAAEALKKKKQVEVAGLPDSQRLSAPNATAVMNTTTAEVTADGG